LPGDGPPSSWAMNVADAQFFEEEWNQHHQTHPKSQGG